MYVIKNWFCRANFRKYESTFKEFDSEVDSPMSTLFNLLGDVAGLEPTDIQILKNLQPSTNIHKRKMRVLTFKAYKFEL